jgi:hypothetical protein
VSSKDDMIAHLKKENSDFHQRYIHFKTDTDPILEIVTDSARLIDNKYYTDHGPAHVTTVVDRVADLTRTSKGFDLNPFECFSILLAAQIHDAGMLRGRKEHEKQHAAIFEYLNKWAVNKFHSKTVQRIAAAHTGSRNSKASPIELLPKSDGAESTSIRPQYLAALVRLADELADDHTRVSQILIDQDCIPHPSQAHHQYCAHLHQVDIHSLDKTISLDFVLPHNAVTRKFGKGPSNDGEVAEIYILDEIYDHTLKLHLERIYCMRYCRSNNYFEKLKVCIEVYADDSSPYPLETIEYTLQESGYPPEISGGVFTLCQELEVNGMRKDGAWLHRQLEDVESQAQ